MLPHIFNKNHRIKKFEQAYKKSIRAIMENYLPLESEFGFLEHNL